MPADDQGHAVEDYARRLAGGLGVPDFVYEPVLEKRRRGVHEVSDGLLIAGRDGLIIQVKSRSAREAAVDTAEKAAAWCRKKGAEAQRQAHGTRRTLLRDDIKVRSLRGFERPVPDTTNWPSVVILDHPGASAVDFPTSADTLFLSLPDWLHLHRMVRSSAAVINYVRRALDSGLSVPFGREVDRYRQLTVADLDACGSLSEFPSLPPMDQDEPGQFHAALVDNLVDRVAQPHNAGFEAEQYLRIVEQLDRIPLIGRVRVGARLERALLAMRATQTRQTFTVLGTAGDRGQIRTRLGFLCDYYNFPVHGLNGRQFIANVGCYAMLRQQQALEAGASLTSSTLGIGVLYAPRLGIKYEFALISGQPPEMPVDVRSALELTYGPSPVGQ